MQVSTAPVVPVPPLMATATVVVFVVMTVEYWFSIETPAENAEPAVAFAGGSVVHATFVGVVVSVMLNAVLVAVCTPAVAVRT